jgi:hypothetical protein
MWISKEKYDWLIERLCKLEKDVHILNTKTDEIRADITIFTPTGETSMYGLPKYEKEPVVTVLRRMMNFLGITQKYETPSGGGVKMCSGDYEV